MVHRRANSNGTVSLKQSLHYLKLSTLLKKSKLARNISKKENIFLPRSIEVVGGERVGLLVEAINFI